MGDTLNCQQILKYEQLVGNNKHLKLC
uniref:Uncharacterized protein n=1 Tax=Tetranychus urticae TaxID=32264 RepID=T1KT60_TETUR